MALQSGRSVFGHRCHRTGGMDTIFRLFGKLSSAGFCASGCRASEWYYAAHDRALARSNFLTCAQGRATRYKSAPISS